MWIPLHGPGALDWMYTHIALAIARVTQAFRVTHVSFRIAQIGSFSSVNMQRGPAQCSEILRDMCIRPSLRHEPLTAR